MRTASAANRSPASLKGKVYPDEHKVLKAEESRCEVLQLTSHPADDIVLTFTNRSFVPDDNGLVFASKRTGEWNLFYMNLKDFTFVQLTDGKKISGAGAAVCAATGEVFYREGQSVKAVNLKTLAERTLTTVPDGYFASAISVTVDGKALAISISEEIKLTTQTNKIGSAQSEHFYKRPWSAMWTGNADGTGWHEIARQRKWISRAMISPTNSNVILYGHEGPWDLVEQKLWLVNADGSNNRPLRPKEKPEVAIGHEFWFADGIHVGYMVHYDKDKPMVGVADIRDGSYHEYPLPFSDVHMQASRHGNLFIGDGSEKQPFLNLYQLEGGKITGQHIFRHGGSFAREDWHPHPAFSPDDTCVLFASTQAGNSDVYLIRLLPY